MSKVKAGGSSKNIHNNPGQRLGVKRFGGQKVRAGEVLVRQTGATKIAGEGTYISRNLGGLHRSAYLGRGGYSPRRLARAASSCGSRPALASSLVSSTFFCGVMPCLEILC